MSKTGFVRLVLAAVAALAFLAACVAVPSQQAATVPATAAASAPAATQQALAPVGLTLGSQRSGDLAAWLSSRPVQPVRGAAEMDAYLVGAEGQPVTDARVTFDTDMTNMSHGPQLVPAVPAGNGHYVGDVHFMMPGPWRVIAIVERPGRETAKLRFEFMVKMN
jgi:hypothetical protein